MRPLRTRLAPAGHDAPQEEETRILVVDDVPEIGQIFRDVRHRVRKPRVHLVTEVNSRRAIELLRREPFHIVVSDYRMREMDGIEVLKAAREQNPEGYRILMTGYNEIPTSVERLREAGIDAYVQKPLRGQEILLLLLGFLNHEPDHIRHHRAEASVIESLVGPGEASS